MLHSLTQVCEKGCTKSMKRNSNRRMECKTRTRSLKLLFYGLMNLTNDLGNGISEHRHVSASKNLKESATVKITVLSLLSLSAGYAGLVFMINISDHVFDV